MAQDLTVNIKTTSDVPQAMDKAKQATTGFGKQIQDIKNKFATSFKDIFLSFLGPMALLGAAIGFIGKMIADNQKKQEDANQAAIDGTNALMSAEDQYWANKKNNEKKAAQATEAAQIQRIKTTEEFLESEAGDEIVSREMKKRGVVIESSYIRGQIALDPKIQKEVQDLIAKEAKAAGITPPANVSKDFKGPEGFGNVIGVGPNPVMEAMNAQLEEQRKQTGLLQNLVDRNPFGSTDFTKSSSPSRAAMLMGN
jgi:hypothetical protein